MFDEQVLKEMWTHYRHAKEKHPFFADRVMVPGIIPITENCGMINAILIHRRNKAAKKLWNDLAKQKKRAIKRTPSVENVLDAELYELYAAVANGDLKQARYEIFDAIAVLLRLDEEMEDILGQKKVGETQE